MPIKKITYDSAAKQLPDFTQHFSEERREIAKKKAKKKK